MQTLLGEAIDELKADPQRISGFTSGSPIDRKIELVNADSVQIIFEDHRYHGSEPTRDETLHGLLHVGGGNLPVVDAQGQEQQVSWTTFSSPESLNEVAQTLGFSPGKDVFKFISCDQGGEIPAGHYVAHLADGEAPQATGTDKKRFGAAFGVRFYLSHDRELTPHMLGWWLMPPYLRDSIVEQAKSADESGKKEHISWVAKHADLATAGLTRRAGWMVRDQLGFFPAMRRFMGLAEWRDSDYFSAAVLLLGEAVEPQEVFDSTYNPQRHDPDKAQRYFTVARQLAADVHKRGLYIKRELERIRPDFGQSSLRQLSRLALRRMATGY